MDLQLTAVPAELCAIRVEENDRQEIVGHVDKNSRQQALAFPNHIAEQQAYNGDCSAPQG